MKLNPTFFAGSLVCVALAASSFGADNVTTSSREKEAKYLAVLKADAPAPDKAIACKQLAIYGTKDAVPEIAPLLTDQNLSSWARIALEAIPGPEADEALRGALTKVRGRLLIGVINSIGYRRDAKAVKPLVEKLQDADTEVASAAAVALGHVGGSSAAQALKKELSSAPTGVKSAVGQGCVLCAEGFMAAGKPSDAVSLYDAVRKADVPKQRILEGTRGAILARQAGGLPLLIEELKSTDKGRFEMALRTARELPGSAATAGLGAELDRMDPDRQPLLLLAMVDRHDATVWPKVLTVASTGAKKTRVEALVLLERWDEPSSLPVLLQAAADTDADVARAAKTTLARLAAPSIDADLSARLTQASGKQRQVLLELAGQRRMESAIPIVVKSASDPDVAVRGAAVATLGIIGKAQQAGDLVTLLQKTQNGDERRDLEKALVTLGGRCGPNCAAALMPLAQSSDPALRVIGLQVLASVGGSDALAAVTAAIADSDESVQDEAASALSTWADNWPDDAGVAEPLLTLAKSAKKPAHRILGLRGYLSYLQGDKKLGEDTKVTKLSELLPLMTRTEERRLAISVLGGIPHNGALELLAGFVPDPAIAEEACLAIVNLSSAKDLKGTSAEARQKALRTVIEKSKNDATKQKAEKILAALK